MKKILICIALAPACLSTQLFAMNGGEWYENCRELMVLSNSQQETASADKKLKYRDCQMQASHVFCEIISSDNASESEKKHNEKLNSLQGDQRLAQLDKEKDLVRSSCPTGQPFIAAVNAIEENGGPGFIYKWLPASFIIKNALLNKYPNCIKVRNELNISIEAKACNDFWNHNEESQHQNKARD